MDSNEIRDRLLLVARDKLRDRPGAYRQFQYAIQNTVQGMAWVAAAQAMPAVYEMGEQFGSPQASQRISEHLARFVDEWARAQPLPPAVEPLSVSSSQRGTLFSLISKLAPNCHQSNERKSLLPV